MTGLTDSIFDRLFPGRRAPGGPAPEDLDGPWVVAGLGNPGEQYERTRHNAGLWCIDELARRTGAKLGRTDRRARTATVTLGGAQAVLVAPRLYVNESGVAVRWALERFHSAASRLIVVLDEINLAPGEVRIRRKGSPGGHNGMKSIIASVGTDEFVRVRIGVGEPHAPDRRIELVLGELSGADRLLVDGAVKRAADAVEAVISEGVEPAMNRYN